MTAWVEIQTGNIQQWVCTGKVVLVQPHEDGSVIMLDGGNCLVCSEPPEALVKRIAGKGKMSGLPKQKKTKPKTEQAIDAKAEVTSALIQLR
tara:strand:- start:112 stop:387 length:276 start_codon:yes stop_codon:yes gene_type:complete